MDITIEYGTTADLDAIEQLYNDLHSALETGTNYPGWKRDIYPIRETAETGIEHHTLFVARYGIQIVGSIILTHSPESGYNDVEWQYTGTYDSVFVIHTFVVHPDFSNLGVGTQLMEFAERFAVQNNMKAVRLDVYEKNFPAIHLYKRCGYQYIKTIDLGYGSYGLPWFQLYEKIL